MTHRDVRILSLYICTHHVCFLVPLSVLQPHVASLCVDYRKMIKLWPLFTSTADLCRLILLTDLYLSVFCKYIFLKMPLCFTMCSSLCLSLLINSSSFNSSHQYNSHVTTQSLFSPTKILLIFSTCFLSLKFCCVVINL